MFKVVDEDKFETFEDIVKHRATFSLHTEL